MFEKIKNIKNIKRLWKPFVFLFLLSFLIINWGDISQIFPYFSYRVVWARISEPFIKISAAMDSLITLEEKNYDYLAKDDYFYKEGIIEIPKIRIEAPVIFLEQTDKKDFEEALERGVLYYPNSALPGEEGSAIILGHSAPSNWPKINYDWVFNDLNKLETGDIIYIFFNYQRYNYKVRNKFFFDKGEEIPLPDLTNFKSVLTLLSCWPPGKDQKRIAVETVLQ